MAAISLAVRPPYTATPPPLSPAFWAMPAMVASAASFRTLALPLLRQAPRITKMAEGGGVEPLRLSPHPQFSGLVAVQHSGTFHIWRKGPESNRRGDLYPATA